MDLLNWIDHHQSLRHMLGAQHLTVVVDAQQQLLMVVNFTWATLQQVCVVMPR
jgi:hypothetical protein